MNNIIFYELFNYDINYKYIDYSIYGLLLTYLLLLYYNTYRGIIFRTYILNLICVLLNNYSYYHYIIERIKDTILYEGKLRITRLIDNNIYLSRILDTNIDINENNLIMRTNHITEYNYTDMFIYKNIDITTIIPNKLSPHRWENIINELEHIVETTHINIIYNEMPNVINQIIESINNAINPWNSFNIDKYLFEGAIKPIIRIPISYTICDSNTYIDIIDYIDISLLSFSIVFSYVLYKLIRMCIKKK